MKQRIMPPAQWQFPVLIILGILAGLIVFIIKVSNATSYLSDNSQTCVNCHIMVPQYATWNHSSHREWASCNDCHVPHNNMINKYYFKVKDGLRHAFVFTLRAESQVIFIKEEGAEVVHQNCIRCHEQQITDAKLKATVSNYTMHTQYRKCWECHREVPHGRVNSLSSTPNARVPLLESPIPKWLQKYMKK